MVGSACGAHLGVDVMPRHRTIDWMMLLALTVMWGSAFMLTKIAVGGLSPTVVAAGRLAIASLLLLLIVATVLRRLPTDRRFWLFCIPIAFFGNALPFSLISWGQGYVDSGLAGILMAAMPLVTLGLAHYLVPGETMTPYRAGGFLLGFIGVIVLIGPDALWGLGSEKGQLLPMLAILGGAISYAVSAILARLRPVSSALSTAAATTLIATLFMLPVVLPTGGVPHPTGATSSQLLAVALLGVFSTATAAVVYFRLISSAGPAFVSQLNYLIPLWAMIVGVLFLGETIQPSHLYALLLILGGILVTQMEGARTEPLQRQASEA